MNTAIARQITSDIKWLLEDASLAFGADFRVATKVKDGHYETLILGCNPDKAEEALAERARNIPGVTFDHRVYDGALIVRQPIWPTTPRKDHRREHPECHPNCAEHRPAARRRESSDRRRERVLRRHGERPRSRAAGREP